MQTALGVRGDVYETVEADRAWDTLSLANLLNLGENGTTAGSLPAAAVARLRDELRTGLRPLRGSAYRGRRAVLHKRAFAGYDRLLHESPRVRHLADPGSPG